MEVNSQHAFTLSIDWEDFGQLLCRDHYGMITPPLRDIDRQTDIILALLDETGKKATFFVLGMLAEYRPDLVRKIADEGHEIGLHGQQHINMRRLSHQEALDDVQKAYKLVTDAIGTPVYGYRAPYFSIDESNFHVLEILADLGLIYDSSIFPIKLKRYGIANFPEQDALYQLSNGKQIVELPLTVAHAGNKKLPVAGGGYIRAFPKFFVNKIFRQLNEKGGSIMLYMHPYEFDTQRIDCRANYPADISYSKTKTFLINLRWNLFRNSIRHKIRGLLQRYEFVTCLEKAAYVKSHAHSPTILGRP
jgi:polysaccharide deacetylase family protein (PEP-CTERM system associated)